MTKKLVGTALASVLAFTCLATIAPRGSKAYEATGVYFDDRPLFPDAPSDDRAVVENAVLTEAQRQVLEAYINTSHGEMVLAATGIGSSLAAQFGGYRQALGALTTQVGQFILRSLVNTWVNDASIGRQANSAP